VARRECENAVDINTILREQGKVRALTFALEILERTITSLRKNQ
jgi:hypothetical protein